MSNARITLLGERVSSLQHLRRKTNQPFFHSETISSSTNDQPLLTVDNDRKHAQLNDSSYQKLQSTVKLLSESLEEQGKLRALLEYTSDPTLFNQFIHSNGDDSMENTNSGLFYELNLKALKLEHGRLLAQMIDLRTSYEEERKQRLQLDKDLRISHDMLLTAQKECDNIREEFYQFKSNTMSSNVSPRGSSTSVQSNLMEGTLKPPQHPGRIIDRAHDKHKGRRTNRSSDQTLPPLPSDDEGGEEVDILAEFELDVDETKQDESQSRHEVDSVENNTHSDNSSPDKQDTMLLDIDLGGGAMDTIVIHRLSEPMDLAYEFLTRHQLPTNYFEPLLEYITVTQNNVFGITDAANSTDAPSPERDSQQKVSPTRGQHIKRREQQQQQQEHSDSDADGIFIDDEDIHSDNELNAESDDLEVSADSVVPLSSNKHTGDIGTHSQNSHTSPIRQSSHDKSSGLNRSVDKSSADISYISDSSTSPLAWDDTRDRKSPSLSPEQIHGLNNSMTSSTGRNDSLSHSGNSHRSHNSQQDKVHAAHVSPLSSLENTPSSNARGVKHNISHRNNHDDEYDAEQSMLMESHLLSLSGYSDNTTTPFVSRNKKGVDAPISPQESDEIILPDDVRDLYDTLISRQSKTVTTTMSMRTISPPRGSTSPSQVVSTGRLELASLSTLSPPQSKAVVAAEVTANASKTSTSVVTKHVRTHSKGSPTRERPMKSLSDNSVVVVERHKSSRDTKMQSTTLTHKYSSNEGHKYISSTSTDSGHGAFDTALVPFASQTVTVSSPEGSSANHQALVLSPIKTIDLGTSLPTPQSVPQSQYFVNSSDNSIYMLSRVELSQQVSAGSNAVQMVPQLQNGPSPNIPVITSTTAESLSAPSFAAPTRSPKRTMKNDAPPPSVVASIASVRHDVSETTHSAKVVAETETEEEDEVVILESRPRYKEKRSDLNGNSSTGSSVQRLSPHRNPLLSPQQRGKLGVTYPPRSQIRRPSINTQQAVARTEIMSPVLVQHNSRQQHRTSPRSPLHNVRLVKSSNGIPTRYMTHEESDEEYSQLDLLEQEVQQMERDYRYADSGEYDREGDDGKARDMDKNIAQLSGLDIVSEEEYRRNYLQPSPTSPHQISLSPRSQQRFRFANSYDRQRRGLNDDLKDSVYNEDRYFTRADLIAYTNRNKGGGDGVEQRKRSPQHMEMRDHRDILDESNINRSFEQYNYSPFSKCEGLKYPQQSADSPLRHSYNGDDSFDTSTRHGRNDPLTRSSLDHSVSNRHDKRSEHRPSETTNSRDEFIHSLLSPQQHETYDYSLRFDESRNAHRRNDKDRVGGYGYEEKRSHERGLNDRRDGHDADRTRHSDYRQETELRREQHRQQQDRVQSQSQQQQYHPRQRAQSPPLEQPHKSSRHSTSMSANEQRDEELDFVSRNHNKLSSSHHHHDTARERHQRYEPVEHKRDYSPPRSPVPDHTRSRSSRDRDTTKYTNTTHVEDENKRDKHKNRHELPTVTPSKAAPSPQVKQRHRDIRRSITEYKQELDDGSLNRTDLKEVFTIAIEVFDRATMLNNSGDLSDAIPLYENALRLFRLSEFRDIDIIEDEVNYWINKEDKQKRIK